MVLRLRDAALRRAGGHPEAPDADTVSTESTLQDPMQTELAQLRKQVRARSSPHPAPAPASLPRFVL